MRRVTHPHVGDDFQFSYAEKFNQYIGECNVSSVTDMSFMVRTLDCRYEARSKCLQLCLAVKLTLRCYHHSFGVQRRLIKTCAEVLDRSTNVVAMFGDDSNFHADDSGCESIKDPKIGTDGPFCAARCA